MTYPTAEQVEAADIVTLCRWSRFLPSPGMSAAGAAEETFVEVWGAETAILDRILVRQRELGGITPAISKQIGWGS